MSGPELYSRPRRIGRGASLTLIFMTVLAAGAATGSWPGEHGKPSENADSSLVAAHEKPIAGPTDPSDAAAEAMADGKSPTKAAQEAVSRSGDRWGSVYSQGEYEEFEQALDGEYTGIGLRARRTADGSVQVSKVRQGSPAQRAGIREGDRIAAVDGEPVTGHPVTEVLALLRGKHAGTPVHVGLQRGTRAWSETLRRANLSTESVTSAQLPDGATLVKVSAFTKGSATRCARRSPRRPRTRASCSTCGATPEDWSPRRSGRPPRSSTAGSWRRTTYAGHSGPCTHSAGPTRPDRWSCSSTAGR